MKVLLLSSTALLQRVVAAALQPAGHDVRHCPDAAALRAALRDDAPDAVLLGTAQGAALCAELRDAGPAPPCVLLSPDPADAEAAREAGALLQGVPFSPAELLGTLEVATRARQRILLCDDSALIHRYTTPILEGAGYEVCAAHDGAAALAALPGLRPDLVITDVEMPEMDGYALCRAIKDRQPYLPVIICSTLGEAQDIERGFDAGADDYLVKPAQEGELLSRVGMLLRRDARPGGRERLLVVDDSAAIRQMIAESLRRQGFSVLTAADGEAGLQRARAERPDLVLTDYDMPRRSGFELVHALKQDEATRDLPVIMLTARESRRDQAQMRAVGLSAYLVKPFAVDKCVALVERVLAERRLRAYKDASRLYISRAALSAAEQAAQSGDLFAVRATEQVVSILFSDIRGFTPLAAQRGAREIVELLNSYFDTLCPVIREEGGDIDKFIGDAIMAVFEDGPGARDAAPLRAVRAGLRMQEALRRWNATHGHGLGMRIGINTGTVVRGDIGSRHVRRDYTVIGDVVNRAQRFEQSAPVGGVLIGPATYQAVKPHVRCEERPGIRLKGVDVPVQAYLAMAVLGC